MKNLTTTICAIVWIFLLAASARAQQVQLANMPAAERAQWQTQRMKETLQLDSAQVAKVSSINLSYARQMDPVISGGGSRITKIKAFRQINTAKEKELQGVLSPQQFSQFKQQQQEMKEQLKNANRKPR
ncbi:MAG: hypothetical protein BGO21_05145 [Dyadobacter sp. 50-39]|uniref:hypothetical protein n=1 Tax=Dyadobacter sp. 50-39 TaxID=1895756 RepID=UPI00095FA764|nr:hypothetical protein [Dyadobacter sp. 50-39]OJV22545.1 MAG: hypothetical protein BGO21_05145 [Dyadobacter sp. 50-39]